MSARRLADELRAAWQRDCGATGGFLPPRAPLARVAAPFQEYLELSRELPHHHPAQCGGVRGWLGDALPRYTGDARQALAALDLDEQQRLMTSLAALGHAYRWDTAPPPERADRGLRLPDDLALPWDDLAKALGVPRVGSHWNLFACNWTSQRVAPGSRYDPDELSMETMDVAEQWLWAPYDEQLRRFSLLFVLAESRGARAVRACVEAIDAAARQDSRTVASALAEIAAAVDAMREVMSHHLRAPSIDPATWLQHVQPTYAWDVEGESLNGPNGLQIAALQALDATLGVASASTLGRATLENRAYMPPGHRRVLAAFDAAGSILREFVADSRSPTLKWRFNDCVTCLRSWRLVHLQRAQRYIRGGGGAGERFSTGLAVKWRDEDPSETGTTERALAHLQALAVERLRETVAARVAAPPQGQEVARDDVAFAFLTADERARLFHGSAIRHYARDDVLIEQGRRGQPLMLIESGTAAIAVDGATTALRVRPGDVVGEISFVDDGPASASVVAQGDVEAIVLTR
ncbi:MAG: hypothetical protein QOG94_3107, partial [Solirubrobacteraceae bacterium]|nr:hypothetical protein [Solirubrobacteraceae bacterium]